MDEKRAGFSLRAPGSSGGGLRLPGRGGFPPIDEHLVVPEITRDEIIRGRRVVASPADAPHSFQHGDLYYVLHLRAAPGYRAAVDLLTRHAVSSDFATDACVVKEGIDPATGRRYLEEMAFEVVSTQSDRNVTEKAEVMHGRGVRRIFGIWVKSRRKVCEWSAESGSWRLLDEEAEIEDRCLRKPLPVVALFDAAAADNAVAEDLIAKGNPTILRVEAAAEARGEARGEARSILKILEGRGIAVSSAQREEILGCTNSERLDRWLLLALTAGSAAELLEERR